MKDDRENIPNVRHDDIVKVELVLFRTLFEVCCRLCLWF